MPQEKKKRMLLAMRSNHTYTHTHTSGPKHKTRNPRTLCLRLLGDGVVLGLVCVESIEKETVAEGLPVAHVVNDAALNKQRA